MKKVLIWILVPILVAVLTVVGTVAYLTATDAENNTMTVGDASIKIVEFERENVNANNEEAKLIAFNEQNKLLHPSVVLDENFKYTNPDYKATPTDNYVVWEDTDIKVDGKTDYKTPIWDPDDINNELDKMVFVKNTGKVSVYVRICFAFEAGNYVRFDRFTEMVHLNKNGSSWTWDWVEEKENHVTEIDGTRYYIAWATYQNPVAPGEYTEISLSQIALDFAALNDHAKAFGEKYEVLTFAQGVQADEFKKEEGAAAALTNAFGDSIPFENVKHVEFTDLETALHYLNADKNGLMLKGGNPNKGEPASDAVNRVTFGLTKDHPDVAKNRNGVLVANKVNDADFTAYTYYVPTSDGEQYDIYVLADNWKIFAPANSYGLFYRMKGLTKVDTSNIDFSYATSFQDMFRDCQSLTELDTSDWDVSKVTNMRYMFQLCEKLDNIDVSNWNTSSLSDATQMFINCQALTSLDVSNWDVSNLTKAAGMFRSCGALTYLDVSKWKVDKVDAAEHMFHGCSSLQKLDVSDWKLDKVASFISMFEGCSSLTALDVSQWTISSANNTSAMFSGCSRLEALNVSNFDVSKVTSMENMFRWCSSLKSLDLSTFKVDKVTTMKSMFDGCGELVSLNLSNWNVGEVTDMSAMFASCAALPSSCISNISGWNVAKVAAMENLFKGCSSFIEIDLSGWTTSSLTNTRYMFAACTNLKTIYVGGSDKWIMSGVNKSDFMFSGCDNLEGSNGTKIYLNYLDKTYARVDTADTPGYLTLK